jgi:prophage antirepressor-like protein
MEPSKVTPYLTYLTFHEVYIDVYGTPDHPLFNAEDVCVILGIITNKPFIDGLIVLDYEVITVDRSPNQKPYTILTLTSRGVYSLIAESSSILTSSFREWFRYTAIPTVRKIIKPDIKSDTVEKSTRTNLNSTQERRRLTLKEKRLELEMKRLEIEEKRLELEYTQMIMELLPSNQG